MKKRVLIENELYEMMSKAHPDASTAIKIMLDSSCLYGATLVAKKGIPPELLSFLDKIPPEQIDLFIQVAESVLSELCKAEKVEIKSG